MAAVADSAVGGGFGMNGGGMNGGGYGSGGYGNNGFGGGGYGNTGYPVAGMIPPSFRPSGPGNAIATPLAGPNSPI